MGRIRYFGAQKAFEGTPMTIPDEQSIQYAVKMTLPSGSRAGVTKNMQTIATSSIFNLFDPKRTTAPVDMAQFRGYPKPTVTLIYGLAEFRDNNVAVNFGVQTNNIVGYPITHNDLDFPLEFKIWVNTDELNAVTPTVSVPIGSTLMGAGMVNFSGSYGTTATVTLESEFNQTYYYINDVDSNGKIVLNLSRSAAGINQIAVITATGYACNLATGPTEYMEFLSVPTSWTGGTSIVSSELNGGYNSAGDEGTQVWFLYAGKLYEIEKEIRCLDSGGVESLPDGNGDCQSGSQLRWRWRFIRSITC